MSISLTHDADFGDVATFLNVETKTLTLYELRKEFTSHATMTHDVDQKLDLVESDETDLEMEDDDTNILYDLEQFLNYIHPQEYSKKDDKEVEYDDDGHRKYKPYVFTTLSRRVIDTIEDERRPKSPTPTTPIYEDQDEKQNTVSFAKDTKNQPSLLGNMTNIPLKSFKNDKFVCCKNPNRIQWQFGFVQAKAKWRPEFMDVIRFKQFNINTIKKVFKSPSLITGKHYKKWKNLYWFFDTRSAITKKQQQNAQAGMKKYLNEYHDGIILKFDNKRNISEYTRDECFELIKDDDAIDTSMVCGVLRAYCHCDVVEFNLDIPLASKSSPAQKAYNREPIKCLSCKKGYDEYHKKTRKEQEMDKFDEDGIPLYYDDDYKSDLSDDIDNEDAAMDDHSYWVSGISHKHKNMKLYLCGKCVVSLVMEGTDKDRIDIDEYLSRALKNNKKILELCLVHRLFSSSSQLMQLLINEFCKCYEDQNAAGMLKVINFCTKWIHFLWFEDFAEKSKSRLLLNKFISFLLEKTNGKNDYGAIWMATQKLLKYYRDQYLLQQQIMETLDGLDVAHPNSQRVMSPNVMANYRNYFNEEQDIDDQIYKHDLFDYKTTTDNQQDIPKDLQWYGHKSSDFFQFVCQKRGSIDEFRKYQQNQVQNFKTAQKNKPPLKTARSSPHVTNAQYQKARKKRSKSIEKGVVKEYIVHTRNSASDGLSKLKQSQLSQSHSLKNNRGSSSLSPTVSKKLSKTWKQALFGDNEKMIVLQQYCLEFAEQLTLISFDLFNAIRPTELLRKAWTKKDKNVLAPNIGELIIFMESIVIWAKFEIASEKAKFRANAFERICRIGIELLELGNQYGAVQIYLALISSDLKYFKIDSEVLKEKQDLVAFMKNVETLIDHSRNHAQLRAELWKVTAPAIPYLGVFLKDAFKAAELLKDCKMRKVNPTQMSTLYDVYDKIELFRTVSYMNTIQRNNNILHYIQRQLHRAKRINVQKLTAFCKSQSKRERSKKKTGLFSI